MFNEILNEARKPMMGININDDKYAWTGIILDGSKTVETRNGPSLRPYVGRRVGIVRTGKGKKALLVGYMTISSEIKYSSPQEFNRDVGKHHVGKDTGSYNGGTKYGYVIKDVKKIDSRPVNTRGIISRQVEEE